MIFILPTLYAILGTTLIVTGMRSVIKSNRLAKLERDAIKK